jgi:hypothetical protein
MKVAWLKKFTVVMHALRLEMPVVQLQDFSPRVLALNK